MCLSQQSLTPKSRRIRAAGFACLILFFAMNRPIGSLVHHHALYNGLRFLLASCAIGFMWSARCRPANNVRP